MTATEATDPSIDINEFERSYMLGSTDKPITMEF